MSPNLVAFLMIVAMVILIGLDIWLALDNRDENTYSELTRKLARVWRPFRLLLPFTFGLLTGHFFW